LEKKNEITPAMMSAGVLAFYEHDHRFEEAAVAVERIYLAMTKAKIATAPGLPAPFPAAAQ
jgi:hypothetical protein